MKISPHCLVFLFPIFLLFGFAFSLHISYGGFEPHMTTSRALLQAKTPCSEDFANKNYTIITSKCKGPNYPAEACCKAFKEFACPLAEVINNEKTDCASTMFSYINLYGRYPPGIFANMCKDGKEGLDCNNVITTATSRATSYASQTPLLMILFAFAVFLFQLF